MEDGHLVAEGGHQGHVVGAEQLGVNVETIDEGEHTTDALRKLVNALLGTEGKKGVVDAICEAPLTSILTIVGNLSYFIANNNIDVLIQNLVAPVMAILELLESVITRDEIDALLEGLVNVKLPGGRPLTLSNIIGIAGDKGEGLVAIINDLIGGIRVYEKDANGDIVPYTEADAKADTANQYWAVEVENEDGIKSTVYWKVLHVIDFLPANFFEQFAKYVVEDSTLNGQAVTTIGDDVDGWNINCGEALMYILTTVLDYNFFETLLKKVGLDLSKGIGEAIIGLADKENELVDVILMLFTEYKVVYKKLTQADLDEKVVAPYDSFKTDEGALNNANTNEAVLVLDSIVKLVVPMVANGQTLSDLINGLIADADLVKPCNERTCSLTRRS